ncbi:hypothetical protein [Polycladidibacter hongkongensis]|uniref:hypothetical protein n=1 Tax=Polycladidibacter hongkongensis TaxID=1647556 RepID=UPI00082E4E58|nr:hypothetical protein [Pseudovibrio hongkongensis]
MSQARPEIGAAAFARALTEELDWFAARGVRAKFWWRDDDAVANSPALQTLVMTAKNHSLPLTLAVIPLLYRRDLIAALNDAATEVRIAMHGLMHKDARQVGSKRLAPKKNEVGAQSEVAPKDPAFAAALKRLESGFGTRVVPLFVPPWNRIAPRFLPALAGVGFSALSTYGFINRLRFAQVQCHLDPVDWRANRGFIGYGRALHRLRLELRRRRCNHQEPIGLLTHHLVHDEELGAFLQVFFEVTRKHEGACWPPIDSMIKDAQLTC